ncbi:Ankyrin repeat protein 1 [Giardia muris]|uniref:Ankyrin repeat protein 1 n=1 Tax=Giardia muris TaxID=5742 RepID=A0A4Z1SUG3_GIAMU|nr:Ankyrin repeat protein 1 [Giardia muris]|eukprot:TNJ29542.1 Ankyrin repeat protein 1 [Giardia muris]
MGALCAKPASNALLEAIKVDDATETQANLNLLTEYNASSMVEAAIANKSSNAIVPLLNEIQRRQLTVDLTKRSGSMTELMQAAQAGDVDGVREHLHQVGACCTEQNGQTALWFAAKANSTECVKLLVVETCIQATCPRTALLEAAVHGNTQMAGLLTYQAGRATADGWTAMMEAARNNSCDIIKLLFSKERGRQTLEGNEYGGGMTALMIALLHGNIDAVKLLEGERDIMTPFGDSWRKIACDALQQAKDNPELFQRILACALKLETDPLLREIWAKNFSQLQGRIQSVTDDVLLDMVQIAKACGWADLLRILQEEMARRGLSGRRTRRTSLRGEGASAMTNLMRAARNGDVEGVKKYIDETGQRDPLDNERTALMYAAENGHAACVALLMNEARMQDKKGWSALIIAAWRGYEACVELLLAREAGLKTLRGETALIKAAERGHTKVVNLLAARENQLTTGPRYALGEGSTALMVAALYGHANVLRTLLRYDSDSKNADGISALDIAMQRLQKCRANGWETGAYEECVEVLGGKDAILSDSLLVRSGHFRITDLSPMNLANMNTMSFTLLAAQE